MMVSGDMSVTSITPISAMLSVLHFLTKWNPESESLSKKSKLNATLNTGRDFMKEIRHFKD